ncbi:MAG TPA: GNAT family N-acetyltransferase [Rhodothermales bacterium]|nr:GNAT family N-acetyltransferase [Rhodothermales bacterium]
MKIVPAVPRMAATLTEIAWEAKRFWGYPDEWMEAWRDELLVTADVIQAHETWVAERSGRQVGFYVLRRLPDGSGAIDHLWVRPDSMRLGIGSRLLEHALDRAHAAEMSAVSIVSDPNAEVFYLRHGARRVGVETGTVCGRPRELPVLAISPE